MEICSGCKEQKIIVEKHMFDGMCAECTDRALYDYEFAKKAENFNKSRL